MSQTRVKHLNFSEEAFFYKAASFSESQMSGIIADINSRVNISNPGHPTRDVIRRRRQRRRSRDGSFQLKLLHIDGESQVALTHKAHRKLLSKNCFLSSPSSDCRRCWNLSAFSLSAAQEVAFHLLLNIPITLRGPSTMDISEDLQQANYTKNMSKHQRSKPSPSDETRFYTDKKHIEPLANNFQTQIGTLLRTTSPFSVPQRRHNNEREASLREIQQWIHARPKRVWHLIGHPDAQPFQTDKRSSWDLQPLAWPLAWTQSHPSIYAKNVFHRSFKWLVASVKQESLHAAGLLRTLLV